ncbi:hypothetical protein [Streptomyces decoyicus]|uniref:hypothetical protein n=1 Tax=Streptomyces decoyicus TaxID=249567 RepID=UPI0038182A36
MARRDGKVETRLANLQALRHSGELTDVTALALKIWSRGERPEAVRVRIAYLRNAEFKAVADERKPLPVAERPLAARLIAPKGVALKFHLMQLFAAQCQAKPGKTWKSPYPVEPTPLESTCWMGLIAAGAKYEGPGIQVSSEAVNKRRQLTEALKKLETLRLVRRAPSKRGLPRGFALLCENGGSTSAAPVPYTVPTPDESFIELPVDFFTRGWVQLLNTSEIVALLMWLDLLKFGGRVTTEKVPYAYVTGEDRQGWYGLGREAYETHQPLRAFGLLDVWRPEERYRDGKWADYGRDDAAALRCHRIFLEPGGMEYGAYDVILAALKRRDALGEWGRSL